MQFLHTVWYVTQGKEHNWEKQSCRKLHFLSSIIKMTINSLIDPAIEPWGHIGNLVYQEQTTNGK